MLESGAMDEMTRALDVYRKFFGEEAAQRRAASAGSTRFCAPITEMAMRFAFGGVWSRDGLEPKQRSLVTMGVLIANRQTEELKKHVQIALRNGLTPREIEEVLIQATPYVGLPAIAPAIEAVGQKLEELGVSLDDMGAAAPPSDPA